MNPFVRTLPDWKNFCHAFRRSTYRSGIFLCALVLVLTVLGSRAAYATTYTVTDTTDNATDSGSLRYAVNTAVDGDTITFLNVIGTITLTPANGALIISHSITITGPGAGLLTISGNNATTVFIVNSGTVSISGLAIANSNAGSGVYGAITNGGTLTVTGCDLSNNANPTDSGGAILNFGTLTVMDSTFSGNTAGVGGAIGGAAGTLTVENSTFSGNTAQVGGAIYAQGMSTVENSTFYGNNPTNGPGGAIFLNSGTMTVSNSTISGNEVDGIWNNGSQPLTISNSIVSGNIGGDCENCGTQGSNNLIGGTPDLGPLQYNGGATQTMMPLPGSPAIGAGSGSTLATDQRVFARSTGATSDLGAVQTNYLTVTNLNDSGPGSLRDAITTANTNGSGDIIFQSGITGTITLASTLPSIVTSNVNFEGPGATQLTVSGNNSAAVFDVSGNLAVVNLRGMTVKYGNSTSYAGGLSNSGLLTVENSAFSYNNGAEGGAVFNDGSLIVEGSTFSNNVATDGGGILNQRTLIAVNTTFSGNRAYNGNGGGVSDAGGTAVIDNSTFSGNDVLNGGVGGGVYNSGPLVLENTIVSGNTNLQSNTADDCSGCGTQSPANLIGGAANLGSLTYNGLNATVQTLLPLPGSVAIQAGDPTQLLPGVTTDERGFPRLTAGKLDLGAAQSNYTAVQFVQQPTNTVIKTDISPAVTVEVLETNSNLAAPNNTDPVDGIAITLTFSGAGTLAGTLTQTAAGGVASFADLNGNTVGTGDALATSITVTPVGVTPPQTLTATSTPFDITLAPTTVNFNPPLPASVTYGVSPLTLKATAYSGGTPTGQTVAFQVDSGPATVSGNVLTIIGAGTVVVEVDAAANTTYGASDATVGIQVNKAASKLALTASATQITPGTSVTLTATATSATTGTPTGTVTFTSGSTQLGTATLNGQGVATLAVTTLPVGTNAIAASYAGDTNFTGSQALLNGTIVVGNPSFNMTVNPVALTIQRGHAGVATVTLTPVLGYSGTVSLSCSTLPQNSSCHFQPQSVVLNGSGNPVQVTLAIQIGTPAQSRTGGVASLRPIRPLHGLPVLPAMFFWLPGARPAFEDEDKLRDQNTPAKPKSKSSAMLWMIGLLVLSASLLGVIGCDGMSPNNPPPGRQTVTVIALGSGGINQSAGVQVTVQ
ncbi:MAG: choice-of-anchor Q domain-containing protein [Acidobacteriaceae bacterium]